MKKTLILAAIAALALGLRPVAADMNVFDIYDESPALKVYNGYGSGTNVTLTTIGGGLTNYVVVGTFTNTVLCTGSVDTITELAAAIAACTNAAGSALLTVDKTCSLDADSIDGELVNYTNTVAPNAWGELRWDTSDVKFYSVHHKVSQYQGGRVALSQINGNVTGTGAGTVSVYVDQSLVWQTVLYTNVYSANGLVGMPIDTTVGVARNSGVMVRCTRTTATTGGMGMVLTLQ